MMPSKPNSVYSTPVCSPNVYHQAFIQVTLLPHWTHGIIAWPAMFPQHCLPCCTRLAVPGLVPYHDPTNLHDLPPTFSLPKHVHSPNAPSPKADSHCHQSAQLVNDNPK